MIALWHRLPVDFEAQLAAIGHRAEAYHFDDGGDDSLRAADALEAMGLRGVFFVVTDWIGRAGSVTEGMVRELAERGHEIGNHSHTHRMLTLLAPGEVRAEIRTAQEVLGELVGTPRRFAWPNGRHNRACDRVAERFGFLEVRDISNVVRRIAEKTPDDLGRIFG